MKSRSFIEPDMFLEPNARVWAFGNLEPQSYSLIMIDPPWTFVTRSSAGEGKSPQAKYRTMTVADIANLPVADLAADDCLLWMWGTAPMQDVQIEILKGWGFAYSTSGVWVKTTKTGKINFGTGYSLRNAHEPFFIGTRGSPDIQSRSERSVIMAQIREHSRKPDEAYDMARRLIPHGRAADVFSRQSRDTWEAFGDEAGQFDGGDNAT